MADILPEVRRHLVANIKALLVARGISQTQLAKRARVGQKTVNNLMNLLSAPTIDTVSRLADALDVHIWELVSPSLSAESVKTISSYSQEALEIAGNYHFIKDDAMRSEIREITESAVKSYIKKERAELDKKEVALGGQNAPVPPSESDS